MKRIGFFSFGHWTPSSQSETRTATDTLLQSIDLAVAAEELGADGALAFLAPDLIKAAVEGRLPRGIAMERLRDAPAEWSRQFEALGLKPH
jgi:hypothetical protein